MSLAKEKAMLEWQDILQQNIYVHIDNDSDRVLQTRAKKIKNLLGDNIQVWLNCDKAHSIYTGL